MRLATLFWAGAGYFALAQISLLISHQPGNIATLWYANAYGVCFLLTVPRAHWWSVMVAITAANVVANLVMREFTWLSLAFTPGNLLEMTLAAYFLQKSDALREVVTSVRQVLRALFWGGMIPSLFGALVGATVLYAYGLASFDKVWFSWFEGSTIGAVSVLPLGFIVIVRGLPETLDVCRRADVATAIAIAVGVSILAPQTLPFPFIYLCGTLMAVAVIGGFSAVAVANLLCSLAIGTLIAIGAFPPPSNLSGRFAEALFYFPLFLVLIAPLLLAAAFEREKEQREEAARREANTRNLYQETPAMMCSVNLEGRITNVNQALLRRLGYEAHEILGCKANSFLTLESARYSTGAMFPHFMHDRQIDNLDYQFLTKSGERLDAKVSAIWELDADHNPKQALCVIRDVTAEKRLGAQLLAEQELIQVTLRSIGDGVVTTDEAGRITFLNSVAEAILGWSSAEATGQSFADVVRLFDDDNDDLPIDPVAQCLLHQKKFALPMSTVLRDRQGQEYGVQDSVAPILSANGEMLGCVMVFQDVTEARAIGERMTYLAYHDSLTGLPNRILLLDRLTQSCQLGLRQHEQFAVVFIDLDHFKHVNDSLGHALGDELLKVIANRLTGALRASDTVSRLGGDEFVVLLADLAGVQHAREVAEKIIREVATPCILSGTTINVTLSMGISLFPADGIDPETLMKHADATMYRSKREGRSCYHFFSKIDDDAALVRLKLESDLRHGITAGQFQVHYQPIVDASTHRAVAVEALVRWFPPESPMQTPERFIPVAEETGLIVPLGNVILEQVCKQLRLWAGTPLAHLRIAVNVSPLQLIHASFIANLAGLLQQYEVPGEKLELEITETALMSDPDRALALIWKIKAMGIHIAIDDFGTGYSSLSYLKRFPMDTLKIDQTFVRELEVDHSDRALVKAILAMSQSLGLNVVAEGVETVGQAKMLADMDCHTLQGYLFAKPADSQTVTFWLSAQLGY